MNYKEAIDRILVGEEAYQDPGFSAQGLAERLDVSPYKLSRILRSEYGSSYTELVHELRIGKACRCLRQKRFAPYSVDDIGAMVGFRNRQSFFTAFKKTTGTTPEQYRQKCSNCYSPSVASSTLGV